MEALTVVCGQKNDQRLGLSHELHPELVLVLQMKWLVTNMGWLGGVMVRADDL